MFNLILQTLMHIKKMNLVIVKNKTDTMEEFINKNSKMFELVERYSNRILGATTEIEVLVECQEIAQILTKSIYYTYEEVRKVTKEFDISQFSRGYALQFFEIAYEYLGDVVLEPDMRTFGFMEEAYRGI